LWNFALNRRKVLVVKGDTLRSVRISLMITALVLALPLRIRTQARSESFSAEGVVVAIQQEEGAERPDTYLEPYSLGEFAEVWMVQVNRWPHPAKPKYVLIEYTHTDHFEPFIKTKELDDTVWRFEIRRVPLDRSRNCTVWGERFVSTAFGKRQKLPPPRTLQCFEMERRPTAAEKR
jgi:hypothetical protein